MPPRSPHAFEPSGNASRGILKAWSVRHARALHAFYRCFEHMLIRLAPFAEKLGFHRLEKPVAALESQIKGTLFGCRMCGQCQLSKTGLSCPMGCPKAMRNGPCGGVREDGGCEVIPEMPCVWLKAWEGAARIPDGRMLIASLEPPTNHSRKGTSSWLAVMREGRAMNKPAAP